MHYHSDKRIIRPPLPAFSLSLPCPSAVGSCCPHFSFNPSTHKMQLATTARSHYWLHIDATGECSTIEVDRIYIMRRCNLPARDMRLIDPLFDYPSTILPREKAIVVCLEQIRCFITADELFVRNPMDPSVLPYNAKLKRRMSVAAETEATGAEAADRLPFEFKVLDVTLETACSYLASQIVELEAKAYSLLDGMEDKISTSNLQGVRELKSDLVALARRVQKVRDEIEQLMDDDGDMAEMYLTKKSNRMSFMGDHPALANSSSPGTGISFSAPVCPVASPADSHKLEKKLSTSRSRQDSVRSSENAIDVQELEMMLEEYFLMIDSSHNKLTKLKQYIDDTENYISFQLDNTRNQILKYELMISTAAFVIAIFGVITGIFGMNFEIPLFQKTGAFRSVIIISGLGSIFIFCLFIWFLKWQRLMQL